MSGANNFASKSARVANQRAANIHNAKAVMGSIPYSNPVNREQRRFNERVARRAGNVKAE